MNSVHMVGIDLSKNVFQIHAVDARGTAMLREKMSREKLKRYLMNLPDCTVAMEACGGSSYWGRMAERAGKRVRLISPQFVKPYVKSNKNDAADAEAIAEAAGRPGMRFVAVKHEWQHDILMIHRVRERLVRNRTALMNELRGFLNEYGIVIPLGIKRLRERIMQVVGGEDGGISEAVRNMIWDLYEELVHIDGRIKAYDARIREVSCSREDCRRLETIPGVGPVISTALVASVGDPSHFKNGRQMAAWLGLVPRQHSSGGKQLLLGISKRGDGYLRKQLVHGARSVMYHAGGKEDRRSRWIQGKIETRGKNKTCVAIANKIARISWAVMKHKTEYMQ
jgi:transposase